MNHLWLSSWRSHCSPKELLRCHSISSSTRRAISQLSGPQQHCRVPPIIFPISTKSDRSFWPPASKSSFSTTKSCPLPPTRRRPALGARGGQAATRSGNENKDPEPQTPDERITSLSRSELISIFADDVPPSVAARSLLSILQSRRQEGTLDLDFPTELQSYIPNTSSASEKALQWLRREYSLDEDSAILARIEREEAEKEVDKSKEYIERAEKLRFLKPQSGQFGVPRGENDSVYGQSVLDRVRKENAEKEARRQEELEREEKAQLEKDIASGKIGPTNLSTEVDPRAARRARLGRSVQRYDEKMNEWANRYRERATSNLTLDSPEIAGKGTIQRLWPTFLFATTLSAALLYYSANASNPSPSSRLLPHTSLSVTTVGAIIGLNALVFLFWRFPPAWPFLNRYFLSVTATPVAITSLTNTFSHSSTIHLAANMLALWLFGPGVHESVLNDDRSTFLALYLTAGVISSLVSLSFFTLTRNFLTTSTGASGAVMGIFAAQMVGQPNARYSFWLLPEDLQKRLSFSGKQMLELILGMETFGALATWTGLVAFRTNFVAHIAGVAVGVAWAWAYRKGLVGKKKEVQKERRWWEWGGTR
ncbi:MAG: hypothetical protein Q9160_006230 [Pyrenula sp. 1 TL-2023]